MISIISIARRKENAFLGFSDERLQILCVAIKCLLMPYKCLRLDAFWSCVGENMVLPNVRSNWLMLSHLGCWLHRKTCISYLLATKTQKPKPEHKGSWKCFMCSTKGLTENCFWALIERNQSGVRVRFQVKRINNCRSHPVNSVLSEHH